MAYDPSIGNVVLYGGVADGGNTFLGDTWVWNGTTWTQVQSTHAPGPLYSGCLAYDPQFDALVLFGGYYGYGTENATWLFQ